MDSKLKRRDESSSDEEEEEESSECSLELVSYSEEEDFQRRVCRRASDFQFEVTDKEGFARVYEETSAACGGLAGPSFLDSRRRLEMGIGAARRSGGLPAGEKTALVNMRLPNRRKQLSQKRTKLFCCQFMPNQQQIAVGSQDEVVRFYGRGSNGRYTQCREVRVPYTGWSILDVSISPEGSLLAYSTWSDAVFVGRLDGDASVGGWSGDDDGDPAAWRTIHVPPDQQNRMAIFSLRFSADGRELLCGGADDRVHLVDVETEKRTLAQWCHEDDVNAVAWGDSDGNLIITAGDDGLCKVWDRRMVAGSSSGEEAAPVGVFAGHRDGITFVDPKGDGRTLLTNSKDQSIKIWDMRRFSSSDAVAATRSAVGRQQWDYRWQPVPTSSRVAERLHGDSSLATLRGHSVLHTLVRARWSPAATGQRFIYTGCARGDVVVYDSLELRACQPLEGHAAVVRDCLWLPDTNEIFSTSWDGTTAIWQWDERKMREEQLLREEGPARRKMRVRRAAKRKRQSSTALGGR